MSDKDTVRLIDRETQRQRDKWDTVRHKETEKSEKEIFLLAGI